MKSFFISLFFATVFMLSSLQGSSICATHIYHNHMPNFWPYFDVETYSSIPDGAPVRYMYDGQVVNLKNNPPASYTYYLPDNSPMPHDDLVSYYSHHAKPGAYCDWPPETADHNKFTMGHNQSQTHVTMTASVINNVQSFVELQNHSSFNHRHNWGEKWRNSYYNTKTTNNFPALDLIHMSGHHTMGPLTGNEFLLKDLIYHSVTLSRDYFLGNNFKSSKGFFPTELGFSTRIIPVLKKLGIEWSVIGNVHFSRTLSDYPYLDDPGVDCLISPPNRSDMRNVDPYGGQWVARQMFNEQQVTHNKFPFASIPHFVRYIDPWTGEEHKVAGIPVEQAASWEEGYQGSKSPVDITWLHNYNEYVQGRIQYHVIAHDGDNSQGAAGDGGTWLVSGNSIYTQSGVTGKGVDEYLKDHPIPQNDIVHVQDGSWIDTRDSSSDPTWYHWRLPFGIWKGQFSEFNSKTGLDLAPKKNIHGVEEGMTVSMEHGYHYLERNFALLQAALNYAVTAEQIWLDKNPSHWAPSTDLDFEIVGENNTGNQLNPYLMSYPVKGESNPAELAWYFLIASVDSGFGYYDENVDDVIKPTISFNQSLYFSVPFVTDNIKDDKTGPSIWWTQRWPYNPGSANVGKAEGWTLHYFDNNFVIYTYAFDVSEIKNIRVRIRTHKEKRADPLDRTYQVYNPELLKEKGIPQINPENVGEWINYPMEKRDLTPDINGVDWQPSGKEIMGIVQAQKIGDLYFAYIGDYKNQLIDYYIEAVDGKNNVSRSPIQQVYVGAGKFKESDGKIVEEIDGDIEGTYPFLEKKTTEPTDDDNIFVDEEFEYDSDYEEEDNEKTDLDQYPDEDEEEPLPVDNFRAHYYHNEWESVNLHYCLNDCENTANWTEVPGITMEKNNNSWFSHAGENWSGYVEFVFNDNQGNWDNNNENNYNTELQEFWVKNGTIYDSNPDKEKAEYPDEDLSDDVESDEDGETTDKSSGCGCSII
jgi:hypothetical protein